MNRALARSVIRWLYDPAQPRTPAGSPDGGQWTDGGATASVTESKAFKAWFKDSKVVDDNGDPLVVYHGTTYDVQQFAPAGDPRLNPESDFGAGIYFTDSTEDASENYAGIGPDLKSRIEQRAEAIQQDDESLSMEEARVKAEAELVGPAKGLLVPAYLSLQNPLVIGKQPNHPVKETTLDIEYEYENDDPEQDIIGEKGALVDFIQAVKDEAHSGNYYETDHIDEALGELAALGADYDGLTASRLQQWWRDNEQIGYVTDDRGQLVRGELLRASLQRAGYDGIIDRTIESKFTNMPHLYGATHYIAFKPTQVKSALGNKTFDPTNPLITMRDHVVRWLYRKDQARAPKGKPEGGQFVRDPQAFSGEGDLKVGMRHSTPKDEPRLKALRVPPAWKHLQISEQTDADLQVTGEDQKGRTQYLYSAAHSETASAEKFDRQRAFDQALPAIREQMYRDLRTNEAALVLALIERTGFRVGSTADTGGDVEAFGATTLKGSHVKVDGDRIDFAFVGKHGVAIRKTLVDPVLAPLIAQRDAAVTPRSRLFQTSDAEVRDYLHEIAGPDFKVKDFRTRTATAEALKAIEKIPVPKTETAFKKARREVAVRVAKALGNTPAVALASYIPPGVFARWKVA